MALLTKTSPWNNPPKNSPFEAVCNGQYAIVAKWICSKRTWKELCKQEER